MKNVFRVLGKMTMTMMFIVLVGLTSCEKEDVFDGKKPTEQVLGGGDEVGNPEDFYPYTDKVIVEHEVEFIGQEYGNVKMTIEDKDRIVKKTRNYNLRGKKLITDTINVGDRVQHYLTSNENGDGGIYIKMTIILFKNNQWRRTSITHFIRHNYGDDARFEEYFIKEIYDSL